MKNWKKEITKNTVEEKAVQKKREKTFETAVAVAVAAVCILGPSIGVQASGTGTSVVTDSFKKLYDVVASIISSLGLIITLWGISEMGMSYQGTDGVMQAHSLRRVAGGLVMVIAPQLLPLLTNV